MPEDRRGLEPALFPVKRLARTFPSGWRDVCFRRLAVTCNDGMKRYECPLCARFFDHSEIDFLHGDHVWPYSMCGETSWENYQLICGSCNASKRDYIDSEIRRLLGTGEFRRMVATYLDKHVSDGDLSPGCGLGDLLRAVAD